MRIFKRAIKTIAVVAAIVAFGAGAYASEPTAAQMQAIQACAAKQGVDLPAPPPGPPPSQGAGDQAAGGDRAGSPPPQNDGKHQPPPRLNDAQKAVLDDCFKASGLTPQQPPQGHHMKVN